MVGGSVFWKGAFGFMGLLHLYWAVLTPLGAHSDEALHLLLSRSIASGSFSWPDGRPVNDPLPGFPCMLALPLKILEPHWLALRIVVLIGTWGGLWAVWRMSRRALPEPWAKTAALLTGLNPILVRQSGLATPDAWFALLPALWLSNLPDRVTLKGSVGLGLGGAVTALIRPEGALFALILAVATGALNLPLGALQGAISLAPLGLWTLRNRLLTGVASGYISNWLAQSEPLGTFGGLWAHAERLIGDLIGRGVLGFSWAPPFLQLIAGAAMLGGCAYGAVTLLRSKPSPWVFAAAAYAALLGCLHLDWASDSLRYALPLVPFVWFFSLAGAMHLRVGAPRLAALSVLLAAPGVLACIPRPGVRPAYGNWRSPRTIAWIQAHVPAEAPIESVEWELLSLAISRPGVPIPVKEPFRDEWVAGLLWDRIGYVLIESDSPDGLLTSDMSYVLSHLEAWCRTSPWLERVFELPEEGTSVYRAREIDRTRFSKAWTAFLIAGSALRDGRRSYAESQLRNAVRIEPRLAVAWAALATIEADPAAAVSDLEKAVEADPTSETMRDDLRQARMRARKRRS
jgi:hypothetical protein